MRRNSFTHILRMRSYIIKRLWSDLVEYFQNSLVLPTLTPQTVFFGFLDFTKSNSKFKKKKKNS